MIKLKTLMCVTAAAAALHVPLVHAQALSETRASSNATQALSTASGLVVQSSVETAAAVGQLSVAAIQVGVESTVLVLRGVGNSIEVSLQIGSGVARGLSLAVGTVVHVVAESVGHAFRAGGQLIAYIPNEAGRSLLYQTRLK